MNRTMNHLINKLGLFLLLAGVLCSCEYKDIADTGYIETEVYMQGARQGIYKVDDLTKEDYGDYRYKVDLENNQLIIPLSVYRAGVNRKGAISVIMGIDNDTVRSLINSGALMDEGETETPEIYPSEGYTLPSNVEIGDGEDIGRVNLALDIPFIIANMDKRYVLAVKIEDANVKISDKYSTIIVDFNTRFVIPHPKFSFAISKTNPLQVSFTNLTTFAISYEWEFEPGKTSAETNPGNYTFPGVGVYPVTLKAKGITGAEYTETQIVTIWEKITDLYIKNPGNPFERAFVAPAGRVDILEDWKYTPNVLSTTTRVDGENVQVGGYHMDNDGVIDFYASNTGGALKNAKIYQTFTLPAGKYKAGFTPYSFTGTNECYYVVATGNELPDIEGIATDANVLVTYHWDSDIANEEYSVMFELEQEKTVTLGFVVNSEPRGRVKIESVSLAR